MQPCKASSEAGFGAAVSSLFHCGHEPYFLGLDETSGGQAQPLLFASRLNFLKLSG